MPLIDDWPPVEKLQQEFAAIGFYLSSHPLDAYGRSLERAGQTVCLAQPDVTSSRRWRDDGVLKTLIIWTLIQWLYLIGVSPNSLARLYYPE